jgi:Peptidase A4 family
MPRRLKSLVLCVPVVGALLLGLVVAGSPAASASASVSASATTARGPQVTTWNGYADTNSAGNTYSKVSAQWVQPAMACTSSTSTAAFWVGLDGYSSDSVEQAGTLVECYESKASYYSWWEMYPTNSVEIVGDSVHAGDHITASVTRSGTKYTLAVTDATTSGNSFSTTQTCSACANSSAEWIEEPTTSVGLGRWTVTNATVKSGSTTGVISTFPYVVLGTAGPLNSAGNGFSVP